MNLGHIKRQTDNARKQSHGHGAELTTDAFGALRAGLGLLLSADARPKADSAQMDAKEAQAQLQRAHELQKSLAETAKKHNAFVGKEFDKQQHNYPEEVLQRPIESLAQTDQGAGSPEGGGAGIVPAFGRPDLVLSAPAGVAFLTPADQQVTASSATITGGLDVSATVGRNYVAAVRSGISLFTYGDAKAKRKEQGDKGIKLHAAHGKVDVQAQSGELKAAADKDVNIASTHARVEAAAKEHVLLTAGGAYIKIAGGSIQIHAPGVVQFKAGMKELGGPASQSYAMPLLPKGDIKNSDSYSQRVDISQIVSPDEGFAHVPYKVQLSDGRLFEGVTDKDGRTARIHDTSVNETKIIFGDGEWSLDLDTEHVDDDAELSWNENEGA